jgi:hypothetical protein
MHSRMISMGLRLAAVALASVSGAALAVPVDPSTYGQNSIRAFSGCYEVNYDFSETEAIEPGYQLQPPYHTSGVENIIVDEDRPGHITLQHILTVQDMVIKHWRQEWTYEQQTVFDYKGLSTWVKHTLAPGDSAGRWVQRVLQVDDSPRYECAAPWIFSGVFSGALSGALAAAPYWECEAWSPLPRREAGRKDYNILSRVNRQILTADGWNHEEHNTKLMVDTNGGIKALVKEEGLNSYKRTDAARCDKATAFWNENSVVWHAINTAWENVYASEPRLEFKEKGKVPLSRLLGILADDVTKSKVTPNEITRRAETLIRSYL